ncbi:MAG: hydroxymethylglutaryl-CoA synthase [Proteobacteria bacterium]|nr:hydroxymethylglutaryl-CoA synthase [Pseudomonadota bacterium]
MSVGIESIGIKLPSYVIEAKKIAKLRGMPEEKATIGLGCHMVGLCFDQETVVDLAVSAAERAIARWEGNINEIGMIVVGTESSLDEARPLSAWIAERLQLSGHIRSYEVKHACYAGTLALRQAVEWKKATNSPKSALVIAVDVCLYAPGHAAEVTQGAGAVAMIVGDDSICSVDLQTYPYSEPCFDFWRPTGDVFPTVDSKKSLNAYLKATENCFKALFADQPNLFFESFRSICFHVPFPKMVLKAFKNLSLSFNLSEFEQHKLLRDKILPYITWNKEVGNAYSASLWISVAQALETAKVGEKIACFSYGSGFGSELFVLERNHRSGDWAKDVKIDLDMREEISIEEYDKWRKKEFFKLDKQEVLTDVAEVA